MILHGACIIDTSHHADQRSDCQWVAGKVGAALEDKRNYQSTGRRVEGSSDQLREVRNIVHSDNAVINGGYMTQQQLQLERAREVEQQLMTELQQLTREKEQVTREKEQVTREKEQLTREKEQVCLSSAAVLCMHVFGRLTFYM